MSEIIWRISYIQTGLVGDASVRNNMAEIVYSDLVGRNNSVRNNTAETIYSDSVSRG